MPYLTRVLGTDGYAVYAYVLSFMGVVQTLADFGFTLSGTKKVVAARDDRGAVSELLGSITCARALLITALFVLVVAVSQAVLIMRENIGYVCVAYLATVARSLLPDFVFQGYEDMGPLTTRYFASKMVTLVLTIILVRSPDSLVFVAVADVAGGAVAVGWGYIMVWRRYGIIPRFTGFRFVLLELKSSAIYCISNIGTTLVSGFTTIMVGMALSDPTDIAYWSLAMTVVGAIQSLYAPINNSLYPHVISTGSLAPARKIALLAVPALVIGTALYCYLSEWLFEVLGGEGYESGSWVLIALAPMVPISFYSMLVGWPVLGALGEVGRLTGSTVASGVFNAALLFIAYMTGMASLASICAIRCLSETTLLVVRLVALVAVLRRRKHEARIL